jgi:hypothetical protein
MTKSLYDSNHRYTPEGSSLDMATTRAVETIFNDYVKKGFSPREISHVMEAVVRDLELEAILLGVKSDDELSNEKVDNEG